MPCNALLLFVKKIMTKERFIYYIVKQKQKKSVESIGQTGIGDFLDANDRG